MVTGTSGRASRPASARSAAVSHTWARSAPEKCSVRFTRRSTSTPDVGRSRRWWRRIAPRAGRSGGRTSSIRSNRPGRRRAGSTSHGWFVAPRTNTPSRVARRVHLGEQLVHDVAHGARVGQVRALLAERVDLVEEQHTRGAAPGRGEDLGDVALARTHVHVEHVADADLEEACAQLPGHGARQERLPAAGRPVEQQPAARVAPNARASAGLRIGPRNASSSRSLTLSMPPTSARRTRGRSMSSIGGTGPDPSGAASRASTRSRRSGSCTTSASWSSACDQSKSGGGGGPGAAASRGGAGGAGFVRAAVSRCSRASAAGSAGWDGRRPRAARRRAAAAARRPGSPAPPRAGSPAAARPSPVIPNRAL